MEIQKTQFNIFEPWKTLDKWQEKYIETEGNCFLLCGRQSGKTTAMSIKFGKRAATKKNRIILMIAFTEKQAYNLFFKTLMYIEAVYPKMLCKGNKKPTKHEIHLKNGSKIMCYAAGLDGSGIRTFTVHDLVIDEAAPMSREVFVSTTPMLSVTGGNLDISSTPRGKRGYFYECSKKENFTKFYVNAEDCERHDPEHLASERKAMSKLEYAQEYKAQFTDSLMRIFSDELIKRCCTLNKPESIENKYKHYMGCDIARMGEDQGTFEILRKINDENIHQVANIVTTKKLTWETEQRIIELAKIYNFPRQSIGLDAGAGTLGVSILDHLLIEDSTKKKVIGLNSRAKVLDIDGELQKKILNEDMYNNLVSMMEKGFITLLNDDELIASLKSVLWEPVTKANSQTMIRIFGDYTHIAEGLIRAAWLASKDKTLNIWCC